jgi:hypothetical protein
MISTNLRATHLGAASALFLAVLLSGNAGHAANGGNASLKGTFPFNETIIGVTAAAPANGAPCPQTLAANSVTSELAITNQGMWTFDGAGNVNISDTGVLVTTPGAGEAADVTASAASCGGTYHVNNDNTVDMAYTCGLANGYVQFIVQAHGVITPTNILVAIPPAAGGQERVLSELVGGKLAACAVIGENTNLMRVPGPGFSWPGN